MEPVATDHAMRSDPGEEEAERPVRFSILLVCMLVGLMLAPLFGESDTGFTIARIVGVLILLAALSVVGVHRLAIVLFVPTLVVQLVAHRSNVPIVVVTSVILRALFFAYVTGVIVWHVLRKPQITTDAIAASAKDGGNPKMLYGYGGFDIATLPTFRSEIPAWLERRGVWATANMRGGSEYGEAWHEAGMLEKKQRVFDDFIAAAEYLVRERYTSPQTLGIMGGSNGGLLVGAVEEQRPDLFAVALPAVGVMDMLRYHKFTGGAAWATEYGSSENEKDFAYLYKYSPLHNVRAGACYPATLVTTADHDDRVVPSHSFKFAAAMQEAQRCDKPVLIRIETQGSHGYRPTDKRIAELADEWAFALANMNVRSQSSAGR